MTDFQKSVWFNTQLLEIYNDTTGFDFIQVIGSGDLHQKGSQPGVVLARTTSDGGAAVALFNPGDSPRDMTVYFGDIPNRSFTNTSTLEVRDVWTHTFNGDFAGHYTAKAVRPHQTVVITVNYQGV